MGFQPIIAYSLLECWCECKLLKANIACTLSWGVAFVGITLLGVAHPIWETFQVWGMRRWTALILGCKDEEIRLVAFIFYFVIFF